MLAAGSAEQTITHQLTGYRHRLYAPQNWVNYTNNVSKLWYALSLGAGFSDNDEPFLPGFRPLCQTDPAQDIASV